MDTPSNLRVDKKGEGEIPSPISPPTEPQFHFNRFILRKIRFSMASTERGGP